MPKRFADTELWNQSWFRELSPEQKLAWGFLEAKCDSAGLWDIDMRELRRCTGIQSIEFAGMLTAFNREYDPVTEKELQVERVMVVAKGRKLWLTGFMSSQYEKGSRGLNTSVAAIKGACTKLDNEGLLSVALEKGFIRLNSDYNKGSQPSASVKEEDKDRDSGSVVLTSGEGPGEGPAYGSTAYGICPAGDESVALSGNIDTTAQPNNPEYPPDIPDDSPDSPLPTALNSDEAIDSASLLILSTADKLFLKVWGSLPKTNGERSRGNELVRRYGAQEFEYALEQSAEHKKLTLAYIKGVCQKRYESAEKLRKQEEEKKRLREISEKAEADREQWSKLNLVEMAYGKSTGI